MNRIRSIVRGLWQSLGGGYTGWVAKCARGVNAVLLLAEMVVAFVAFGSMKYPYHWRRTDSTCEYDVVDLTGGWFLRVEQFGADMGEAPYEWHGSRGNVNAPTGSHFGWPLRQLAPGEETPIRIFEHTRIEYSLHWLWLQLLSIPAITVGWCFLRRWRA